MTTIPPTQDVFELTLARPVDMRTGKHAALVHLWWRAPQQGDRLVQVYVDGKLHDVSADIEQRQMWLLLDRTQSHRIELLAVPIADDPDNDVWTEYADALTSWTPWFETIAAIGLIRDESLAVDAQLSVTVDGQAVDRGAMWPADESRSGFGALFGLGGFGHDDATGPGLGQGELGAGPLGVDGNAWRWRRDDLTPGDHQLAITATDVSGQSAAPTLQPLDVTIDTLPTPPADLAIDADFTMHWSG